MIPADEVTSVLAELRDDLKTQLDNIACALDEIRDELRRGRKQSRPRAEIGFRGELGWQCLACGEGFDTIRKTEDHINLGLHCHQCSRWISEGGRPARGYYTLCEKCTEALMQARVARRMKRPPERLPEVHS